MVQLRRSPRLANRLHKRTHGSQIECVGYDTVKTAKNAQTEAEKAQTTFQPGFNGSHSIFRGQTDVTSSEHSSVADHWDGFDTDDFDRDNLEADMEGGVRHPGYRMHCLEAHRIFIRNPTISLPDAVAIHVEQLVHVVPRTPELAPNEVALAISNLQELGLLCYEDEVIVLLRQYIFPGPRRATGPMATAGIPMARHLVPCHSGVQLPIPQPRPDLLYGYPRAAFTETQCLTLDTLDKHIAFYSEACTGLLLPFLTIEFKAAAGTGGNLWVAANQCAGASAACLLAIHRLNVVLSEVGYDACLPSLCYSIAVDNNLAQLYISWKDDTRFYMQQVDSFLLSNPEHFVSFRRRVLAILEWGQDEGQGGRLRDVRRALDFILESRKRTASEAAKSRPGPEGEENGLPEVKRRRESGM